MEHVRYTSHRFSVCSAHPCLFLANIVMGGKGGNPRRCSSAFSYMRQLAAKCLILNEDLRICITVIAPGTPSSSLKIAFCVDTVAGEA
jgi:hypothetical protein